MAFVSSVSLSYWRCAFLLTVAFFLIKSPETVIFNTYVLMFAQIFNNVVVDTLSEPKNEPILGLLATFLILNALSDLIAIFSISSLFSKPPILDANNLSDVQENENARPRIDNKELYFTYFENLVPLRLVFFFALTGYSYITDNVLVGNNLISTYGCIEIWFNFIIFNNLREEKVARYKSGYYTAQPDDEADILEETEPSDYSEDGVGELDDEDAEDEK